MPATPKHPSQRRRRNKTAPPTRLPAGGSGLEAPPLLGAAGLLESTRAYWLTLWGSPMAVVWLAADVPALTRLAILQDSVASGAATAALLAEIRMLEDRYGLSPLARRRLQFELDVATAASSEPARSDDPDGRFLRIVDEPDDAA